MSEERKNEIVQNLRIGNLFWFAGYKGDRESRSGYVKSVKDTQQGKLITLESPMKNAAFNGKYKAYYLDKISNVVFCG